MIRYLLALLALAVTSPQSQQVPVGVIEFFGTEGMDVEKARSVLPVHQGDEIPEGQSAQLEKEIRHALENALGQEPTNVQIFCCLRRGYTIFIGLGGANSHFSTIAAPTGNTCLSEEAMRIYNDLGNAWAEAQLKGIFTEDDSRGYALLNEASVRSKQLVMRQYAVHHERSIERALLSCGNVEQRRAAGLLLGYSLKSKRQIAALVHAGHDPDQEVRNNAVRSLDVLARSSRKTASEIPAQVFIDLLNSGFYTDRNKAFVLLEMLTSTRDPEILRRLRSECLPSLIETARWQVEIARRSLVMLGRIAGIDEARIHQLIESGKGEDLIAAVGNVH
jgi:hypothetical protein